MQARWRGTVIADSDRTRRVEGNHYFPHEDVAWEHLRRSGTVSVCPWKGRADYYDLEVGGASVPDVAWEYRRPFPWARFIRGRVAFWGGVEVVEVSDFPADSV
ncbi:DUF427 domain-containing protein [Nocardioides coralli]|uniref:DUF427 domain-containing protein n=1 Tax=Nocardioides coralli TaxID=2872154 RepID=UPI002016F13D|nr:DUF427 domain-containing protein [Nocardioides coralli]